MTSRNLTLLLHMRCRVVRFHLHAQPIQSIAKEMAELAAVYSRIRKITIREIGTGQQSSAFHISEFPAERIATEPCDVGFARAHTFVFNYRFRLGRPRSSACLTARPPWPVRLLSASW